jgi:hypothetical protein
MRRSGSAADNFPAADGGRGNSDEGAHPWEGEPHVYVCGSVCSVNCTILQPAIIIVEVALLAASRAQGGF